MGTNPPSWGNDNSTKNITVCLTEDCNLKCKYCYMVNKNSFKKMTIETARKTIDFFLDRRDLFSTKSVTWDIIGGEPLLEIDLLDQFTDYFKERAYRIGHPWFESYRFSISSNGILYGSKKVQDYIAKNRLHLSIGLSVDGNKIKHDLQRVWPNGKGSYDDVLKNVPLWIQQYPEAQTKATFSRVDLPHLKDSIISLWSIGIKNVAANLVFEDIWEEGDDLVYEDQLKQLADHVLENELYWDYSVRFFEPHIGNPLSEELKYRNWCGAGRMISVDCEGNLFPCIRFHDLSLTNKEDWKIGHIDHGINYDLLRPFSKLNAKVQSPAGCIECDVATGCAWCTGANYDFADTATVYQRLTSNCKMHKACVRAKNYFWDNLSIKKGVRTPRIEGNRYVANEINPFPKYLQLIIADDATPFCGYRNKYSSSTKMSNEVFSQAIKFAQENGFISVIIGSILDNPEINHTLAELAIHNSDSESTASQHVFVYDNAVLPATHKNQEDPSAILLVNISSIDKLYSMITKLSEHHSRINVIHEDIDLWGEPELDVYRNQLEKVGDLLFEKMKGEIVLEINVLTDILSLDKMSNCEAGETSFSVAPNGKIYICPAFYFHDENSHIGSLNEGIFVKNSQLLDLQNAPICNSCDVFHCRRCKFLNKKLTREINTPSQIQCRVSHIEREQARILQKRLSDGHIEVYETMIPPVNYQDPLEKLDEDGFFVMPKMVTAN